jgi:ribosomal protein S18 acetylase RimI-like enzyme
MADNVNYDPCINIDFDITDAGLEFFTEVLNIEGALVYLAIDGDQPVGYISGYPKTYSYRRKKFFEIGNLGVIPEYRRKGVARQLYEHFIAEIKKLGFERVYLNCYSKNTGALSFYKELGFEEIDVSLEKDI